MSACILLVLSIAVFPAHAVNVSGATYELVGFSNDGHVLTRQRNAQYGVVRFEVLSLNDGKDVDSVYVSSNADPKEVMLQQMASHKITAAGFPGSVSPQGGAAVLVTPSQLSNDGTGRYDVWLADGSGIRIVASLPLESQCAPDIPRPSAAVSISWAPEGRTAVVTGHLNIESPCDAPQMVPVMVIVRSPQPASQLQRSRLTRILGRTLSEMEQKYPWDALPIIRQWLAVTPTSAKARASLIRVRARLGDNAGVRRAVWSLLRRGPHGRLLAADLMLRNDVAQAMAETVDKELLRRSLPFLRRISAEASAKPPLSLDINTQAITASPATDSRDER